MGDSISYHMDSVYNIMLVKGRDVITTSDVMEMNHHIYLNDSLSVAWSALIDLRDVTEFSIDAEGMKAIVEQDRDLFKKFRFEKLAFVSDHDVVFGMMRMYQSKSDLEDVEVMVLRDIDEAKSFLEMNDYVRELVDSL